MWVFRFSLIDQTNKIVLLWFCRFLLDYKSSCSDHGISNNQSCNFFSIAKYNMHTFKDYSILSPVIIPIYTVRVSK